MNIYHSLTLKGCPGTLIEINNGNVVIQTKKDTNASESSQIHTQNQITTVIFSECSFVFNIEIKIFLEKVKSDPNLKESVKFINGKYQLPLFKIAGDTIIQICDCDFRAIIHENEEIIDDNDDRRMINETLFSINNDRKSKLNVNSYAQICSSICSNFYRVIEGFDVYKIVIEKCHFTDIISDAVHLSDPINLEISNSSIINTQTGIKLYLNFRNTNVIDHQNSEILISKIKSNITNNSYPKNIKISENEICQNSIYGIHIHSDYIENNINSLPFNNFNNDDFFNIEISNNKLFQNKANAVFLEKLYVCKLNITSNEINYNFDYGMIVSEIFFSYKNIKNISLGTDSSFNSSNYEPSNNNFYFTNNSVCDNKNNYAVKFSNLKNVFMLIENCNIYNNLYGMLFSNISFFSNNSSNNSLTNQIKKNEILENQILFRKTNIYENMDIGLSLSNNFSTKFIFANCKIYKNNSYGIYLLNNNTEGQAIPTQMNYSNYSTNHVSKNLGSVNKSEIPNVYLKKCEIFNNRAGGILLKNYFLNIDSCKMNDNTPWAVEIPLEKNKNFIKLLNYEQSQLNALIVDPIGGPWGNITNKKSLCSKNGECLIL